MGLFDFLKRKELAEIESMRNELSLKDAHIANLELYEGVVSVDAVINAKQEECNQYDEYLTSRRAELSKINAEIDDKRKQIIQLDNEILLQEYGIYTPVYDFANSVLYAERLKQVRDAQKQMILDKRAAVCPIQWTVSGSASKGKAMISQNIKQILRCFNDECDVLISKVKFNNVEAFVKKIFTSWQTLNKLNSVNCISITEEYVKLKIEELQIAYEYAFVKQKEKEEQRELREQQREEVRLAKEIEAKRKEIEKEQKHYTNALLKINKQLLGCSDIERELLEDKKREIQGHLEDLDVAVKDIDYREANKKAGYVYIISNIGAFGEDIYKIGMTRRLDPTERVDELGDASVPFKFDIHAMIFSDDAPRLEAALHRAFEHKRLNKINNRREFFNVTIEEIIEVIKANYDKTVDFIKTPEAEQYRESLRITSIQK